MFSTSEVPVDLINRNIKLMNPTVSSGDSKYTSFKHKEFFSFNSHTLTLEHTTFIMLIKTLIKRISISLQQFNIVMFVKCYQQTHLKNQLTYLLCKIINLVHLIRQICMST